MRIFIKLLALFSGIAGAALLVAGAAMIFMHDLPASATPQVRVFGLLIFGGAGAWCLLTAYRVFRRPSQEHAVSVCKPAACAAFLLVAGVSASGVNESVNPIVIPIVALAAAAGLYYLVLAPIARRAYPTDEATVDPDLAPERVVGDVMPSPVLGESVVGASKSEFRLTDTFFRGLGSRVVLYSAPLTLLAIVGGGYSAWKEDEPWFYLAALAVFVVVVAFWFSLRRQLRSFRSLRIEVTDDHIARTQDGYAHLKIAFSDISAMAEVPGRGLTVHSRTPSNFLSLPATLERYDELRARLARVRQIETKSPASGGLWKIYGAGIAAITGMIVIFRSDSPMLVLPVGCALVIFLGFAFYTMRRSPHVDLRTRRSLWPLPIITLVIGLKLWTMIARILG